MLHYLRLLSLGTPHSRTPAPKAQGAPLRSWLPTGWGDLDPDQCGATLTATRAGTRYNQVWTWEPMSPSLVFTVERYTTLGT